MQHRVAVAYRSKPRGGRQPLQELAVEFGVRLVADGLPGRNRTEYRRGGKAVMAEMAGKETAP